MLQYNIGRNVGLQRHVVQSEDSSKIAYKEPNVISDQLITCHLANGFSTFLFFASSFLEAILRFIKAHWYRQ